MPEPLLTHDGGWTEIQDDGFLALVGPLFSRLRGTDLQVAIECQDKHRNRRGVVQGGLVMTFADRALGMAVREHTGAPTSATVHLDVHFIAPVRIGQILIAHPTVEPNTRSLMFARTELIADGTVVATATGVFKPLRAGLT